MSTRVRQALQGAAGAAGGAGLNVEDVFSTYLYEGNWDGGAATTNQIVNNIDLSTEGGLVWIKNRGQSNLTHRLFDSETSSGVTGFYNLSSASTAAAGGPNTSMMSSFNSDGFTVGNNADVNSSYHAVIDYASWTFRKAPKFFTCLTYTGNGSAGLSVSHNLGSAPGCIIVKNISRGTDWMVLHRNNGSSYKNLHLNTTNADIGFLPNYWGNGTSFYQPTSTDFQVGTGTNVNFSGDTYVAYLFAHNDGDGEFGPTGDQDIIKCGSYTGTGSNGNFVDLGFEPQWIMVKRTNSTGNWIIVDNMRSLSDSYYAWLYPNTSDAEGAGASSIGLPSAEATGFTLNGSSIWMNASGSTYIYIAIRRGPMAVPESATDVFHIENGTNTTNWTYDAGFPVDFTLYKVRSVSDSYSFNRLTGSKYLSPSSTAAEGSYTAGFDNMSFVDLSPASNNGYIIWDWRRAPSFFDVVAYKGTDVYNSDIAHNLGVAPEMIWVKNRNRGDSAAFWAVYHKDLTATDYMNLNATSATATSSGWWANTEPTATHFTIGNQASVNSTDNFIAYLFASLDGVSKVGSYTGNGSTQTINCGFSSGARFILIKRTDSTGDWYVWDAERGIVSANDPHLSLNTTAAEVTTDDSVDPVSSGFAVNQVAATNINVSSATYIFYAIA